MASLMIPVNEVKRARAYGVGAGGLSREGVQHGFLVEGMGVENPFL